jgi:hypothetical protein
MAGASVTRRARPLLLLVVVVLLVVSSASSSEAQAPSGLYYLCSCVDEFNSDLYIHIHGTHLYLLHACRFRRGYAEASEPRRTSATGTGVTHSGWRLYHLAATASSSSMMRMCLCTWLIVIGIRLCIDRQGSRIFSTA